MTFVLAICVAVTFGVSIYLMLGRELKGIAMGVFLMSHAANLSIIAMSGSPIQPKQQVQHDGAVAAELLPAAVKKPPVLESHEPLAQPLAQIVDPLPQALILTAIVIGFGVMAFLLTLIVVTSRTTQTIEIEDLANEPGKPAPDQGNAEG
ncbi:NADH-quinone oxidoreductase subunit K [Phycisphaeraceae bacterium D3-23]